MAQRIESLYARRDEAGRVWLHAVREIEGPTPTKVASSVGEIGPEALRQLAWAGLSSAEREAVFGALDEAAGNARMRGAPTIAKGYTRLAEKLGGGA